MFYRKRSTFQNVWRESSGTWTLTLNVLKSIPFPMERHKYEIEIKLTNTFRIAKNNQHPYASMRPYTMIRLLLAVLSLYGLFEPPFKNK